MPEIREHDLPTLSRHRRQVRRAQFTEGVAWALVALLYLAAFVWKVVTSHA